jgi:hypothetical protein
MFSFTHFTSLATNFQKCLSFLEVHFIFKIRDDTCLPTLLLGVEIYRGTWHCEDKKSLKMGKTTHFQTLVFREKISPV